MQTMNISLPDPLKRYVEEQVSAGGYSSASEYVRELLRADQQRKAEARLEELLLEGLQSEPVEATPEYWQQLREDAVARARARKAAQLP
jgi:antitoxin ParD1/3/4